MPLLKRDGLEDTLRRLPPQAIRRVLRHGVVPVAWEPGHVHYAICGPKGAGYARRHGLPVVARITSSDFHHCVRRVWAGKSWPGQLTVWQQPARNSRRESG